MNSLKLLAFLLLLTAMNACSFFSSARTDVKSKNYTFDFTDPHWEAIDPDKSDYAFMNEETKSIILSNSVCKKYNSTSLKYLIENMLSGISDLKIEKENKYNIQSRSTLRTYASGNLDGVRVYLIVQTIKKNRCIYDFALISTSKSKRQQDQKSLFALLKSLEIN